MSDGLSQHIKLHVVVQFEPDGDLTNEQATQAARDIVERALKYALPRARFRPPFTKGMASFGSAEVPPPPA